MQKKIVEFVGKVKLGEPVYSRNLCVFPAVIHDVEAFPYLVFSEALELGVISIEEVSGGGHVPELAVENRSDKRIFMMDGEELVGAKQNRILNTSIMIEGHSWLKIPVSCVESGRWHEKSAYMAKSGIASGNLRREKSSQVSESLASSGMFRSNQGKIWNTVNSCLCEMNVISDSCNYDEIYAKKDDDFKLYMDNLKYPKGTNGVVAAINNRITCADIFDSSNTLEKLWNRLIKSYVLDAMIWAQRDKRNEQITKHEIYTFISKLETSEYQVYKSPGLGYDVRIIGEAIKGNALVSDDKVVHLALFRRDYNEENTYRDDSQFRIIGPSHRYHV